MPSSHSVTFQQLVEAAYGHNAVDTPYPAGLLKGFRRYWMQNCVLVPEGHLKLIGYTDLAAALGSNNADGNIPNRNTDHHAFSVDADKFSEAVEAYLDTRPPLCPVMEAIADKEGGAGLGPLHGGSTGGSKADAAGSSSGKAAPSSGTADDEDEKRAQAIKGTAQQAMAVRKAKLALRDLGLPYYELRKQTTLQNKALFTTAGLSNEVSTRIAGAIYKKCREEEASSNEYTLLAPRDAAVAALERRDRSVSLSRCGLCPDDIRMFLPSIAANTALSRLDLSGNNIHVRGAKALGEALAQLPNLLWLSVAGNNLQAEGIAHVCKSLVRISSGSGMMFLDVSCNNGGVSTGAAIMGTYAGDNKKPSASSGGTRIIRHLSVAGNRITGPGIVSLIPCARACNALVLSSNSFGCATSSSSRADDLPAARSLALLLKTCEHLSFVDMSNNGLSERASDLVLTEGIAGHPALTGVEVSMNAFSLHALAAVAAASPQLTYINAVASTATERTRTTKGTSTSTGSAASRDGEAEGGADPLLALEAAVEANKTKMLEFRAFLKERGVALWDADNVRDALTFLLKRRDIAVQVPVSGPLLMTMKGLGGEADGSGGCTFSAVKVADVPLVSFTNANVSSGFFSVASDFEVLCDFLDEFRDDKGSVVLA